MYLEFGVNAVVNAFSSQEGSVVVNNQKVKYDDSGRLDLLSAAVFVHVGWRPNLETLTKRTAVPRP